MTVNIEAFRSLDDIRLEARNATYPNTAAEVKAVTELEQEIDAKVREHEAQLVNVAEAAYASGERVMQDSDALRDDMNTLLTDLERAGAHPTAGLAARYETLRKRMESRIAELHRVEADAAFHAAKVTDPYGSLQELRRKYPQIVAGRRLH